ncbi:unnamed protein product [Ectocarpus sp. CCAP 1310/34]|nr:unnamed protein product [Ectocarpus sp. CCAP 1310/34]
MARAASFAIFCCALTSCRAFHTPVTTTSGRMSVRRESSTAQQECYRSGRRPRSSLSMKNEATAEGVTDAPIVEEGSATATAASKADGTPKKKMISRQDLYEKQPKPHKKKALTPQEQKYLDKMASAPIIYKRNPEQEFYPSVGYESSYPTLEESLKEGYTGDSTVIGEDGKEEVLMRVVVVGGREAEGEFLKNLAEKGRGELVDGLYALWDPTEGPVPETIANIDLINVHELGFVKNQNPKEVAKHAYFLAANMLVAVSNHPSYGDDFVPQLKKAALDNGLTFVGPDLAAEVAKGDMESFTKLVQATRKALEED